jgi:hypothetical protein
VRLLVYGGNEHSERRRIGDWLTIAPQVFQDTYGSSLRSASYGVGVLDQEPFLILRKIQNFGQRAYPLVVLFDPGRDTWDRFQWNGAHLLWSLFGNIDSAGIKVITEPENYHTEEDLARLLVQIDENVVPEADHDAIKSGAQLLDLWAGAASGKSAVIVPVDQQVMGFSSRPDLRALCSLVGKLPASLRCGRGWLFGGRDNHAESLGARLVFDDAKFDPPAENEKKALFEVTRRGAHLRAALDSLSRIDDDEGAELKEYLSKPLFEWNEQGAGNLEESIADILLLKELKDSLNHDVVVRPQDVDERYDRINRRLKLGSALSEQIAAAASQLIERKDRNLTAQETIFILNRHHQQRKSAKIKEKILSNLNKEAACSFFVDNRLFPADAAGLMPVGIRTEVSEKLLKTEKNVANIPEAFRKEAASSPAYAEQDLKGLLDVAVNRSAEFERGLLEWRKFFADEHAGAAVRTAVQTAALHRTQADNHDSLADYLLLADDAGGIRLAEVKPNINQVEMLGSLLGFITAQLDGESEPGLAQKAKVWLGKLAESDLRLVLDLDDKDKIAALVNHGWEGYVCMRQAYLGRSDSSFVPGVDKREKTFLSRELAEAAEPWTKPNFIPDLERLTQLFAPDFLSALVKSLINFEPVLTAGYAKKWVDGWRGLSKSDAGLNEDQRAKCLAKHRCEFIRLMLETNVDLKKTDQPADLDVNSLTRLVRGLLIEGEPETDGLRSQRLNQVLGDAYGSNEIKHAIQQVYDELAFKDELKQVMVRRLVGHRPAVAAIEKRLTAEQKAEFKELLDEKKNQELAGAKNRLMEIFSSDQSESEAHDAIRKVKKSADDAGKEIFGKALVHVFEQLLADDGIKKLFLSGGASGDACLKLYQEHLLPLHKKRLNQLANEKKIHLCISDANESRDKEYKNKLEDLLPKVADEQTRKALNDAVLQALKDKTKTETLIRRFVPIITALVSNRTVSSLRTDDDLFDTILRNLRSLTGRKFMTALWIYYGGSSRGDNPLIEPSRSAFGKLKHYVDTVGRSKRKKKRNPDEKQWLRAIDKSLIDFIAHTPSLKKQIALKEFGSDKTGSIDDYLKERELKSENDKEDESTAGDEKRAADSKNGPSLLRRIGGGLVNLFKEFDDEKEAQQGKDK